MFARWIAPLLALSALLLMLAWHDAAAAPPDPSAQAEFKRLHPCPASGARLGECPGYVVDHVVPLCLGGPDVPYNMQWRPLSEAKPNDVREPPRCPTPPPPGSGQSVTWIAR
jgi:hypothetical protein